MNEYGTLIVTAAIALGGIAVFSGKKFIEQAISHQISKRREEFSAEIKEIMHLREQLIDARLRAYRELFALVYRCRNVARSFDRTPSSESRIGVATAYQDLEVLLYSVRFDLEEPLFDKVHRFKLLLIELTLAKDRERTPAGNAPEGKRESPLLLSGEVFAQIEAAHQVILAALKVEIPQHG